jgi:hypothetical protein
VIHRGLELNELPRVNYRGACKRLGEEENYIKFTGDGVTISVHD